MMSSTRTTTNSRPLRSQTANSPNSGATIGDRSSTPTTRPTVKLELYSRARDGSPSPAPHFAT